MKNIYNKIVEIFIKGVSKDWKETSIWYHDVVLDDNEVLDQTTTNTYGTFTECFNAIKDGKIQNAGIGRTLFRNRPQVYLSSADRDCVYMMTEKNYKTVSVLTRFEQRKHLSMSYLMEHLSAEEFTDYVRSHNLVICPLERRMP